MSNAPLSLRLITPANAANFIDRATGFLKRLAKNGGTPPSTYTVQILDEKEIHHSIQELIDSRFVTDMWLIGYFPGQQAFSFVDPFATHTTLYLPCPRLSVWSTKYALLWSLTPHTTDPSGNVRDIDGNLAPNIALNPNDQGIKSVFMLSNDASNPHLALTPMAISALTNGELYIPRANLVNASASFNSRSSSVAKSLKDAFHDVLASAYHELCIRNVTWLLKLVAPALFMESSTSSTPPTQNFMETITDFIKRLISHFRSLNKNDEAIYESIIPILSEPSNTHLKKVTAGCQQHLTQQCLQNIEAQVPLNFKLNPFSLQVGVRSLRDNNNNLSLLDALIQHLTPLGKNKQPFWQSGKSSF